MWQHVSTSEIHLKASGVKYIKFYAAGLKMAPWGQNVLPHKDTTYTSCVNVILFLLLKIWHIGMANKNYGACSMVYLMVLSWQNYWGNLRIFSVKYLITQLKPEPSILYSGLYHLTNLFGYQIQWKFS